MAKQSIYDRGSIKQGGNEVFCQSRFDAPNYVKEGAHIRFYGDNEMYQVGKVEPQFYIFNFNKKSSDRVFVEKSEKTQDMSVLIGDIVDISYKEYELSNAISIMSGGSGYSVNDIFEVDEGSVVEDIISEQKDCAIIKVKTVDENGGITKVSLDKHGKYFDSPSEQLSLGWRPKGGTGEGAELSLVYQTLDYRSALRREVAGVEFMGDGFLIIFTETFPREVIKGKFSCRKHKMILSSAYVSLTKFSERFQLIVNYTPNYGLPLLADNSMSIPLIYNRNIIFLDKKIQRLEQELEDLKKKLG
jgi:hypothetical protein